jgi:hypothetical protein
MNVDDLLPRWLWQIRVGHPAHSTCCEINCSLDIEAEPSTDKQGTDHLGAAGLPPQPKEHKIRADANPPHLGKLAP